MATITNSRYGSTACPVEAIAFINRCPPELLSMIWKPIVSERPTDVTRLLLVCKWWYALLIEDPQMWTHITLTIPHNAWDVREWVQHQGLLLVKRLERSRTALLHVVLDLSYLRSTTLQVWERLHCKLHGPQPPFPDDFPEQYRRCSETERALTRLAPKERKDEACSPEHVLDLIERLTARDGQYARRWKSLKVAFPRDEDLVWSICTIILANSMPNLSHLQLSNLRVALSRSVEVNFRNGNPGHPWTLTVDDFSNWEFFKLLPASLTELSVSTYLHPSFGSQLSRLSQLRSLTILHTPFHCDPVNGAGHISLPLLTDLAFEQCPKHINMVHFNLPSLKRLHFQMDYCPLYFTTLPIVQSSMVHWEPKGNPTDIERVSSGSTIRRLLLHFTEAQDLCVPDLLMGVVTYLIRELVDTSLLPSSWETASFRSSEGIVRTLNISKLLDRNGV